MKTMEIIERRLDTFIYEYPPALTETHLQKSEATAQAPKLNISHGTSHIHVKHPNQHDNQ